MNKKSKRNMIRASLVVLLTSLVIYFENNISIFQDNSTTYIETNGSTMAVHFIDVGQGDSILIEADGRYMLIDAGDNNKGNLVVDYLNNLEIETLDYVIGTHPHSDHVGGLDTVINAFPIKTVIMPEVLHTTKTFEDVLDAIDQKNLKITKAVVGNEYTLGSASFIIIAPNSNTYKNLNDYSVGIKLTYGNTSFVLTGDAEHLSEKEMLQNSIDLSADVLKLGHHGSASSNIPSFLDGVSPSFAVISVGEDNKYGHPHEETLQAMVVRKIPIFRTDKQGSILFVSDGETITVNKEAYTIHNVD